VIVGLKAAVADLWGKEGLAEVAARLPPEVKSETIDEIVMPTVWHPLGWVIAWHDAVWEGPAESQEAALCRFVDRSIELGFGRVQKIIMSFADAKTILNRASALWRHQHSHGTLTAEFAAGGAIVTLRDHPYIGRPVSGLITAEMVRYIAQRSRLGRARETHAVEEGALVIRLTF
jgi:hypothetical protein